MKGIWVTLSAAAVTAALAYLLKDNDQVRSSLDKLNDKANDQMSKWSKSWKKANDEFSKMVDQPA